MSFNETLPEVEINFPSGPSEEFFIKINGHEIKGTMGVTIKSALAANLPYPTVEICFYAKNVKGKIKGLTLQAPFQADL